MRTDVTDHTQRPADGRVEAPIPVGVLGQPVLQVVPGDQPYGSDGPGTHARRCVLAERVEAVDEADGVDQAEFGCGTAEFVGLRRCQCERLLADDVLAGLQRRHHLLVMEVVRAAYVHGVYAVVVEHLVEAFVGRRQPRRCARSGVEPTNPATETPMRARASACTRPMKPVPTMAARCSCAEQESFDSCDADAAGMR